MNGYEGLGHAFEGNDRRVFPIQGSVAPAGFVLTRSSRRSGAAKPRANTWA